ncbi:MAG: hypothetical protein ACR2G0_10665 [Chthoniobacterales bacterium]
MQRRCSGVGPRKPKSKATVTAEKASPTEDADLPQVGRMERTRRLLLAALHVWELKRRTPR